MIEIGISKRRDELVMLPLAFKEDLILSITVDANPMSFSFQKLSLIFLLIFIHHLPITHLISLEFPLKPAPLMKLVIPYHLLIVPPRSVVLITIGI